MVTRLTPRTNTNLESSYPSYSQFASLHMYAPDDRQPEAPKVRHQGLKRRNDTAVGENAHARSRGRRHRFTEANRTFQFPLTSGNGEGKEDTVLSWLEDITAEELDTGSDRWRHPNFKTWVSSKLGSFHPS